METNAPAVGSSPAPTPTPAAPVNPPAPAAPARAPLLPRLRRGTWVPYLAPGIIALYYAPEPTQADITKHIYWEEDNRGKNSTSSGTIIFD